MPNKQKTANHTMPRCFRLRADTLADLDAIAGCLTVRDGVRRTRTDAIGYAARLARQAAEKIQKKAQIPLDV